MFNPDVVRAKDWSKHFTKEDIQMASAHMKHIVNHQGNAN